MGGEEGLRQPPTYPLVPQDMGRISDMPERMMLAVTYFAWRLDLFGGSTLIGPR